MDDRTQSMQPAVLIIEGAQIFGPEPLGVQSMLIVHGKVLAIRETFDHSFLQKLKIPFEVISAQNCYVVPGFIDPQQLLAGGSGETGFNSQTPRIELSEIIAAGITTVVGCVGADTVTKTQQALLGRVKSLNAEGITSYMYCGGYDVPPVTLTGDIRSDIVLIEEVIGVGELAISDRRSSEPTVAELARIVSAAYVAGTLTNKAGICRFHVGDEKNGLKPLYQLLNEHDVKPESLYPTHVERTPELIIEAAKITEMNVTVDMDTVSDDLLESLQAFRQHGGRMSHLTVSSDAAINSPGCLYSEFQRCVLNMDMNLEQLLPIVTSNTARVLKLPQKGNIAEGLDADILVIEKNGFVLRDVIAKGQIMMREKTILKKASFLQQFKRSITG